MKTVSEEEKKSWEEMINLPMLERIRRMGAMRTHEGMAPKLHRC